MFPSSLSSPKNRVLREKADQIEALLEAREIDLWRLRELALTPGGFVNDRLRQSAWPKLIGLTGLGEDSQSAEHKEHLLFTKDKADDDSDQQSECLVKSLDHEQIERDVNRCTWHLLTGSQRSRRRQMNYKNCRKLAKMLKRKQNRLGALINLSIAKSQKENDESRESRLCYYQGYHDVASIFLSALGGSSNPCNDDSATAALSGLDLPCQVLHKISFSHFRDAMRPDFLQLQVTLKLVLFPLLATLDPELHNHLYRCGLEPFFALSWVITWFSHDIRDTNVVKRLFDFFLVSHPLMPYYLAVAMILQPSNRSDIMGTECDFSELHQALASLPKNSCMVGWKYRVGDGYISEDEDGEDDDGTSLSTGMDTSERSFIPGDGMLGEELPSVQEDNASVGEGEMEDDEFLPDYKLLPDPDLIALGPPARVPFQELIEAAIVYMRRVPPRDLLKIAARYFSTMEQPHFFEVAPSINSLKPCPPWMQLASARADWLIKCTRKQKLGSVSARRKARRVRKPGTSNIEDQPSMETKKDFEAYINQCSADQKWPDAIVVQGFGPGENEEELRRRRRRRYIIIATVAVAALAIAVGYAIQCHEANQRSKEVPSQSDRNGTSRLLPNFSFGNIIIQPLRMAHVENQFVSDSKIHMPPTESFVESLSAGDKEDVNESIVKTPNNTEIPKVGRRRPAPIKAVQGVFRGAKNFFGKIKREISKGDIVKP